MIEWVEVDKKQLQGEVHRGNVFCGALKRIKLYTRHIEALPHDKAVAILKRIAEILNEEELQKLMNK